MASSTICSVRSVPEGGYAFDQLRERSRMRGWLFRVARNASLDWLRAQARRPNKTELVVDLDPDTAEYARNPLIAFAAVSACRR